MRSTDSCYDGGAPEFLPCCGVLDLRRSSAPYAKTGFEKNGNMTRLEPSLGRAAAVSQTFLSSYHEEINISGASCDIEVYHWYLFLAFFFLNDGGAP